MVRSSRLVSPPVTRINHLTGGKGLGHPQFPGQSGMVMMMMMMLIMIMITPLSTDGVAIILLISLFHTIYSSEHNVESSHSDLDFTYNIFSGTEHVLTTSGDDIENLWSDHVTSVVKDTTGIIAVNTYPIFAALYKVTSRKFYSLTRECCNYLEEKLRDVSTHFSNTLEFLVARGDCPYVCIDTETLSKTHMLDKQKFVVLELQEHYHNYNEKRQKTIECLDGIKMALKRSSVGSHQDDPAPRHIESMTHEQRQVRLSWCLYRLHFQFILFCGSYARLVEMLSDAVQGAKAKVSEIAVLF